MLGDSGSGGEGDEGPGAQGGGSEVAADWFADLGVVFIFNGSPPTLLRPDTWETHAVALSFSMLSSCCVTFSGLGICASASAATPMSDIIICVGDLVILSVGFLDISCGAWTPKRRPCVISRGPCVRQY